MNISTESSEMNSSTESSGMNSSTESSGKGRMNTGVESSGKRRMNTGVESSGKRRMNTGVESSGKRRMNSGVESSGKRRMNTGVESSWKRRMNTGVESSWKRRMNSGVESSWKRRMNTGVESSGKRRMNTGVESSGKRRMNSVTDEKDHHRTNSLTDKAMFQIYLTDRKTRKDRLSMPTTMKQLLKADEKLLSYTHISTDSACLDLPSECTSVAIQSDTKQDITLAIAREERTRQGPREAEFSFGGEADLHKHQRSCEKNPGHTKFIPLYSFITKDDLPDGYRKDICYRYIKAMADLTVRVSVSYVSYSRPKTFSDNVTPFPQYKRRGSKNGVYGSGWVSSVDMNPCSYTSKEQLHCKCKECLDSPSPQAQSYYIYIVTAAHLVYDDSEAAATTCTLFFDKGGTPETCDGAVTLSGMKHIGGDIETDWCEMRYETHDVELAKRLSDMAAVADGLRKDACRLSRNLQQPTFKKTETEDGTRLETNEDVLTVVVSHPHGCSKQISFGFCSYIDVMKDEWTRYTYTTATCPGSSGAPVFPISKDWSYHVHSGGNLTENNQLNFSSHGVNMVPQDVESGEKCTGLNTKCVEAQHETLSPGCYRNESMMTEDNTTNVRKKLTASNLEQRQEHHIKMLASGFAEINQYGQLRSGKRSQSSPLSRFKDVCNNVLGSELKCDQDVIETDQRVRKMIRK